MQKNSQIISKKKKKLSNIYTLSMAWHIWQFEQVYYKLSLSETISKNYQQKNNKTIEPHEQTVDIKKYVTLQVCDGCLQIKMIGWIRL